MLVFSKVTFNARWYESSVYQNLRETKCDPEILWQLSCCKGTDKHPQTCKNAWATQSGEKAGKMLLGCETLMHLNV